MIMVKLAWAFPLVGLQLPHLSAAVPPDVIGRFFGF